MIVPAALRHYREATELGMRPLIAHCHLAQEHFATTSAMYRKMG